nr:2-succinyl-6-hydroxy-2,4-cyclohexadiene-1-carboxylate synthase [Bacillus ectoiniformans]
MVNGCNYHYHLSGEGEPLLLLHGFTGDHSTWNGVIDQLQSTYTCVAVDLIGHGKTDKNFSAKRYQVEAVAHDMKKLMNQLGHPAFHVLGYSMGGRLALTLAVLFPESVKSLMLESASPGLKTTEERMNRRQADARLAERIRRDGVESFVDYWEDIPMFESQKKLPKKRRDEVRMQRLENSVSGLALSLEGMGTGIQPSWWDHLSDLKMPVLLITGTLDEKFTAIAEEMSRKLPNAVRKEVFSAGHAIHVEDEEKFGTIIKEFGLLHIREET